MGWKDWSSWLKGGLIIGFIGGLVSSLSIVFSFFSWIFIGAGMILGYPILVNEIILTITNYSKVGVFLAYFINFFVIGFVVGAIIGWIYGKIKNKKQFQ